MTRPLALIVLTLAASTSCASSGPNIEFARLGNLTHAVPEGWKSRDLSDPRITVVEWTPPDNTDAKESVTIMRTSPRAALAKAGFARIEPLLVEAQKNLPQGAFTRPEQFRTQQGFSGARIEGTFVPPGQTQPYHRIHAILIDGKAFLHVLYTARVVDRDAFELVGNSLKGA